jgi:dihydroorotate dehydrogenase (fumarate)
MDLSTRYLGFTLPHPLMLGASPLVDDLDAVRRAEDGGASAIVMHSLFEEQITLEHDASRDVTSHEDSFADRSRCLPRANSTHQGRRRRPRHCIVERRHQ